MAKSPEEMEAAMVENLRDKTGKTLPQWLKIAKAQQLGKHGEIVKFLKSAHGVTHGYANLIAHRTLRAAGGGAAGGEAEAAPGGDDLVDAQYAGVKVGLRPIYDAVIAAVQRFGKDVEVAPKQAYVSLRRGKQFAIVQPSTKTRVDVGINLKGQAPTDRLEKSGSFNAMVSHRVRVTETRQVDAELKRWLKQAYDAS